MVLIIPRISGCLSISLNALSKGENDTRLSICVSLGGEINCSRKEFRFVRMGAFQHSYMFILSTFLFSGYWLVFTRSGP